MKECDLCSDRGFECKEYPFKIRTMEFKGKTQILFNSPIEACKIRPDWIKFKESMKGLNERTKTPPRNDLGG